MIHRIEAVKTYQMKILHDPYCAFDELITYETMITAEGEKHQIICRAANFKGKHLQTERIKTKSEMNFY